MASNQREAGAAVVEARALPTQRRMATGAIATVGAFVNIVLEMAGDALARRALVTTADVAGGAWRLVVRADQGKTSHAMVECADHLPAGVIMATGAIAAEAPLMGVVLGVAGDAGVGRRSKWRGGQVTAAALQAAMLSADRKIAFLMIEPGLLQVDQAG